MKKYRKLSWVALGLFLSLSFNFLLPIISPAQTAKINETLVEADKLYLAGDTAGAEKLYRQVKPPFPKEKNGTNIIPKPITDPQQLSGAGQVYWRNATEGMQQGLTSKIFTPLQALLEKEPQFIPAYQLYGEAAEKYGSQKDVIPILEKGVTAFPDSVELNKALIKALEEDDKWLESSIIARQFAIVYPQNPEAPEFLKIAEKNFKRFRSKLNEKVVTQGILGGIVGAFTGSGTGQVVELGKLLLQGESGMGESFAKAYKEELTLIDDPQVLEYVSRIGNDLANLMGRNDFKYEFYVVKQDSFNAFALPGGKVFVNTGAIMAANSEAELAGLLGHEIGHAVLSHSFQRMTNANLIGSIGKKIPLGNLVSNLLILDYSRENETQSDIIGTRALAAAGYAADGLRNLFFTLKQQKGRGGVPEFLQTHPLPDSRVHYLEALITRNGYNRYAFEGVKKHAEIKQMLQEIL
ncbi:peptidase M48 [Mastigocladus laminosus UU774]|nr:peptidase M48 [Mastigocladus laminosus UU774]